MPEVQKLFKLRNRDAEDLRTYVPEFLTMRIIWKFRMAVQFYELGISSLWTGRRGIFFGVQPLSRFTLRTIGNTKALSSPRHGSNGSWGTYKYLRSWRPVRFTGDREYMFGQIVGDLYAMRNFLAHGDKLPNGYFTDQLREARELKLLKHMEMGTSGPRETSDQVYSLDEPLRPQTAS